MEAVGDIRQTADGEAAQVPLHNGVQQIANTPCPPSFK